LAAVLPIKRSVKIVIQTKPAELEVKLTLTRRAQTLAPDNDKVKKLRDEVVKLLRPQGESSQSGN
jgi:hypothetical protein